MQALKRAYSKQMEKTKKWTFSQKHKQITQSLRSKKNSQRRVRRLPEQNYCYNQGDLEQHYPDELYHLHWLKKYKPKVQQ